MDSLLEEVGFEPSVPLDTTSLSNAAAERGERYVPPPEKNPLPDLMEVYRKARGDYDSG